MKHRILIATLVVAMAGLVVSPGEVWAGSTRRVVADAATARVKQAFSRQALGTTVKPRAIAARTQPPGPQPCRAIPQKCAGLQREAAATRILSSRYPNERMQSETYLLNRNGSRARDPKTGQGRRIDFVMFNRGAVSRRYEVTSQHADKRAQLAKELRILRLRSNGQPRTGPAYVRDRTSGRLTPVKPTTSEVIRFR